MASRRSAFDPVVLAGIVVLSSLGGRQLGAPPGAYAQADPPRSSQRSTATPAGTPAARELFQQHCAKCHGADGTGSSARSVYAEIPDFTAPSWAGRIRDSQLQASILDGKGEGMPSFRGKLNTDQVRELVAQIRTFAPAKGKSGPDTQKEPNSPSRFDEEFRRHEEEMERLRRQFHELPKGTSPKERTKPAESPPRSEPPKPASPVVAAAPPAARDLFQQHCVRCHGSDGSGSQARRRKPEVPDFTDEAWQARRRDEQLLASILDGKGTGMPPERGKLSEEQARNLVAYVRTFAAAADGSGNDEHGGLVPGDNEGEAPDGFFAKLIRWLGNSHPAAVHFPIALLTAAAVAEVLRLATGRLPFDAASRYCVWFGALSAVPAGVLGWFVGGFHLTDPDWVLTTHRWLGTSTAVWAVLVLVVTEVSRRRNGHSPSRWGRAALLVAALLVLATGFFGGAVVFGIDHYAWPK